MLARTPGKALACWKSSGDDEPHLAARLLALDAPGFARERCAQ
jgi:hypothetical protein